MSEEKKQNGNIAHTAKAIAAITQNVPIYQDAIQPAAKELGKGLQVVAKAVNAALVPVEGFVWGVDRIKDFVRKKVSERLENTSIDDIQQPKAHIAVPVIEALRYTGSETDLSELYANLLATSMDRKTAYQAHPSFVEIIKNMSPDEARIMQFLAKTTYNYPLINIKMVHLQTKAFRISHRYLSLIGEDANCQHPLLSPNYIDNLRRLGLVEVNTMRRIADDSVYTRIEEFPKIKEIIEDIHKLPDRKVEIEKIKLEVTDLGKQFIRACVRDKRFQQNS